MFSVAMLNKLLACHMYPWSTKAVISNTGIFVAIANNTLYESKLSFFFYAKNH